MASNASASDSETSDGNNNVPNLEEVLQGLLLQRAEKEQNYYSFPRIIHADLLEPDTSRSQMCTYNCDGYCSNGDSCKFSHHPMKELMDRKKDLSKHWKDNVKYQSWALRYLIIPSPTCDAAVLYPAIKSKVKEVIDTVKANMLVEVEVAWEKAKEFYAIKQRELHLLDREILFLQNQIEQFNKDRREEENLVRRNFKQAREKVAVVDQKLKELSVAVDDLGKIVTKISKDYRCPSNYSGPFAPCLVNISDYDCNRIIESFKEIDLEAFSISVKSRCNQEFVQWKDKLDYIEKNPHRNADKEFILANREIQTQCAVYTDLSNMETRIVRATRLANFLSYLREIQLGGEKRLKNAKKFEEANKGAVDELKQLWQLYRRETCSESNFTETNVVVPSLTHSQVNDSSFNVVEPVSNLEGGDLSFSVEKINVALSSSAGAIAGVVPANQALPAIPPQTTPERLISTAPTAEGPTAPERSTENGDSFQAYLALCKELHPGIVCDCRNKRAPVAYCAECGITKKLCADPCVVAHDRKASNKGHRIIPNILCIRCSESWDALYQCAHCDSIDNLDAALRFCCLECQRDIHDTDESIYLHHEFDENSLNKIDVVKRGISRGSRIASTSLPLGASTAPELKTISPVTISGSQANHEVSAGASVNASDAISTSSLGTPDPRELAPTSSLAAHLSIATQQPAIDLMDELSDRDKGKLRMFRCRTILEEVVQPTLKFLFEYRWSIIGAHMHGSNHPNFCLSCMTCHSLSSICQMPLAQRSNCLLHLLRSPGVPISVFESIRGASYFTPDFFVLEFDVGVCCAIIQEWDFLSPSVLATSDTFRALCSLRELRNKCYHKNSLEEAEYSHISSNLELGCNMVMASFLASFPNHPLALPGWKSGASYRDWMQDAIKSCNGCVTRAELDTIYRNQIMRECNRSVAKDVSTIFSGLSTHKTVRSIAIADALCDNTCHKMLIIPRFRNVDEHGNLQLTNALKFLFDVDWSAILDLNPSTVVPKDGSIGRKIVEGPEFQNVLKDHKDNYVFDVGGSHMLLSDLHCAKHLETLREKAISRNRRSLIFILGPVSLQSRPLFEMHEETYFDIDFVMRLIIGQRDKIFEYVPISDSVEYFTNLPAVVGDCEDDEGHLIGLSYIRSRSSMAAPSAMSLICDVELISAYVLAKIRPNRTILLPSVKGKIGVDSNGLKEYGAYFKLLSLDNIYKNTDGESIEKDVSILNDLEEFLQWGEPSWRLFREEKVVVREKPNLSDVKKCLRDCEVGTVVINHYSGTGGSTYCRQLAFDLCTEFVVVIVHRDIPERMYKQVSLLFESLARRSGLRLLVVLDFPGSEKQRALRDVLMRKNDSVFLLPVSGLESGPGRQNSIEAVSGFRPKVKSEEQFQLPIEFSPSELTKLKELFDLIIGKERIIFANGLDLTDFMTPLRFLDFDKLSKTNEHFRAKLSEISPREWVAARCHPCDLMILSRHKIYAGLAGESFSDHISMKTLSAQPFLFSILMIESFESEFGQKVDSHLKRLLDLLSPAELDIVKLCITFALFAPTNKVPTEYYLYRMNDNQCVPAGIRAELSTQLRSFVAIDEKGLYIQLPSLALRLASDSRFFKARERWGETLYEYLFDDLLRRIHSSNEVTKRALWPRFGPGFVNLFTGFRIWHFDGPGVEAQKCDLKYSTAITLISSRHPERKKASVDLLTYLVECYLGEQDSEEDEISAFATHAARLITEIAIDNKSRSYLKAARDLLLKLNPSKQLKASVQDRFGHIYKTYLRLLTTMLGSIRFFDGDRIEELEQIFDDGFLKFNPLDILAIAAIASSYYQNAIHESAHAIPHPMIGYVQVWVAVLELFRGKLCHSNPSKWQLLITGGQVDQQFPAVFRDLRSRGLLNSCLDMLHSAKQAHKFRTRGNREVASYWNMLGKEKTMSLIAQLKKNLFELFCISPNMSIDAGTVLNRELAKSLVLLESQLSDLGLCYCTLSFAKSIFDSATLPNCPNTISDLRLYVQCSSILSKCPSAGEVIRSFHAQFPSAVNLDILSAKLDNWVGTRQNDLLGAVAKVALLMFRKLFRGEDCNYKLESACKDMTKLGGNFLSTFKTRYFVSIRPSIEGNPFTAFYRSDDLPFEQESIHYERLEDVIASLGDRYLLKCRGTVFISDHPTTIGVTETMGLATSSARAAAGAAAGATTGKSRAFIRSSSGGRSFPTQSKRRLSIRCDELGMFISCDWEYEKQDILAHEDRVTFFLGIKENSGIWAHGIQVIPKGAV